MKTVKSELIQFKVTKNDKEKLLKEAEEKDMNLPEYLRHKLLNK